MIEWKKTGKASGPWGTTIFYQGVGTPYTIESRKMHIPHANGVGTWDYTSYFVLKDGKEVTEKNTLRDAKKYVENEMEGKK